jgi:hypothetical protein
MHSSAVPRDQNQLDRILDLFPDDDSARIRIALSRLLRVEQRELSTSIRDVGDEIAYYAATDMSFRQVLSKAPKKGRSLLSAAQDVPRNMSKRLRKMIGRN